MTVSPLELYSISCLSGDSSLNYNYDEIGRLSNRIINTGSTSYTTNYSYKSGSNGATTEKVESISNNGNDISYTYYDNGNIKTITSGGKVISYKYDEIGELTREDNQVLDKTITYSYDAGGNITEKTEYPYTTGTPENASKTYSYDYNDSNWKDKLTSFDGKEITYDEIGNPLTYDGYAYTWEAGRQLSGISGNGKNITYKYNDSGIRTEKTVDGVTTKYYLDGDKVIYEDNGTDKIYYTYDSSDKLVSMNLNGVEYYYVRNGQNDIIGLIDGNGIQIVSYTYNTWGKLISIKDQSGNDITNDTSSVGYKNPYRYRGYRYDTETGLYYLQSRYYNPEICRILNADDTSILQLSQGNLLGTNLFEYCGNNPVNNSDPTGYFAFALTAGAYFIPGIGEILITGTLIAAAIGLTSWLIYLIFHISANAISQVQTISKADAKIRDTVKRNSRTRYWSATVHLNYVDIGRPLSYNQARSEVNNGRTVFTVTKAEAKALATIAGNGHKPVGPEINKGMQGVKGYYWHFHTYTRNGGHVYYLFG